MSAAPRRRAAGLLSSFYGEGAEGIDELNIDAEHFDAHKYVSSLLQYKSLEELVARGNAMVSEIKSLDSDMQMLVYENYSKFISATDTIQQMKERVDGMAGSMSALEDNFGYVSRASESVSASFSARRAELERLNAVKRDLNKLQFLLELPARLQRCVNAGEYTVAVRCHMRAARLMVRLGSVAAFEPIRAECDTIMGQLSSTFASRLEDEALAADEMGMYTGLLLKLGGDEEALLQKYLARRRTALSRAIAEFALTTNGEEADGEEEEAEATEGGAEAGEEVAVGAPRTEPVCAAYVRQLGALVTPQLLSMLHAWRELFGGESTAGTARPGALPADKKEAMLVEVVGELGGALIDACRRVLEGDEASCAPADDLLAGASSLLAAIAPVHEALPEARLSARATRACEGVAKRAVERRMGVLRDHLRAAIGSLVDEGDGVSLHAELRRSSEAISGAVRAAIVESAPLLAPMCEILRLRADGMALQLVGKLHAAVSELHAMASHSRADPRAVLLCAGVCLQMADGGVAAVPEALRVALAPQGLAGAALGFDAAGLMLAFRKASENLLRRFAEMQAQALSLAVSRRLQATDWLRCAPPAGVTPLVRSILADLRVTQRLAASLFPSEPIRPMTPSAPFPPITPLEQQLAQKLAASAPGGGGGVTSIHKDLQRMFAKKVSFELAAFASPTGKDGKPKQAPLAAMVAHVAKLTLKTLVEEVRYATFSRHGFQQLQVDMLMLRWVLPAAVEDAEPLLSLLDEAFISCQERSMEAIPLEHSIVEAFCETERKQLLSVLH